MAATTLIVKLPRTKLDLDRDAGATNPALTGFIPIDVDATITESHDLTNTITDHPVEEGSNVSDHSRPEPARLSLDCIVSNSPCTVEQQQAIANQALVTNPSTSPQFVPGYAESVWQRFEELHDTPALVTVVTTLKTYSSMGIEQVSAPRSVKDGQALRFTLKLKRVRVVRNKLTRLVVAKDPRAQPKNKTGKQLVFTVDEVYPKSALKSLFGGG